MESEQQESLPFFTVVVVITDRNAHMVSLTMDCIAAQSFHPFEVIVIDGQVQEHSLEIFDAYKTIISRIYHALDLNLYSMMNKGISLAQGPYMHFLMPGEFYISRHAFSFVREFIEQQQQPDLVCCGSIIRHSFSPPQIILQNTTLEELKGSRLSASLQAYWFRKEALISIGKFNTGFEIQGGQDMICRFFLNPSMKVTFMRRILTDYEYRRPSPKKIIQQFWETLLIICRHFGLSKAVIWWAAQNHLRLFRWWIKSIKSAFWKSNARY